MKKFDVVSGYISQGGMPDTWDDFLGCTMVALCAEEFQPECPDDLPFHLIRCPMKADLSLPQTEMLSVTNAAQTMAAHIKKTANRVFVSSLEGNNRASIVSALVMHALFGHNANRCIDFVKEASKDAFSSEEAQRFVKQAIRLHLVRPIPL